jgi:hypothetical protein
VHKTASLPTLIPAAGAVGCITDEVTGKAEEGFSPRVKNLNLIGPKVRRIRHQRSWSQNDLAIRLQLLGMDEGTRGRVSKIEARLVWVSDEDMIYLARALKVEVGDLYPVVIRKSDCLHEAIGVAKASRYGVA